MKLCSPALAILLWTGVTPAQVTTELFARSELTVGPNGGSIAAGTNVGAGFNLNAGQPFGRCPQFATFSGQKTNGANAEIRLSGTIVTGPTGCPQPTMTIGENTLLLQFFAATPTPGTIRIDTGGSGWTVRHAIDLGDDGKRELDVTTRFLNLVWEVPVVLGPSGYSIEAVVSAIGTFGSIHLNAKFIPGVGKLERLDAPCGPKLDGRFQESATGRFVFDVCDSPVTPFAWFGFGIRGLNIPLSANCNLLVDPIIPLPTAVAPDGAARFVLDLPAKLGRVDLRLQYLVATQVPLGFLWSTSEVLRIRLP